MKTLTLLRHAKSGWTDTVSRDFDRPLNAKGRRAATLIGTHLRGTAFDHVVASPAVRVVETLDEVQRGYGRTLAPAWDRRVYLASVATLLDLVQGLPDAAHDVLLVGHSPGLEDLALMLVPDTGCAIRDTIEAKYPTGSLATMTFAVDDWQGVAAGTARLERFVRPRDLDPALGPDED